MSNTKISQMSAASLPLAGTELVPLVQSSGNVQVAFSDAVPILSTGGVTTLTQISPDTQLTLQSVDVSVGGSATGAVVVTSGDQTGSGNSGPLTISTGVAESGNSGAITLQVGTADGTRGLLTLDAPIIQAPSGFAVDSLASAIALAVTASSANNGAGADVRLIAGPGGSSSGDGGNIYLTVGTSPHGNAGLIIISHLPTSSAGLPSGALWNSSGTLKVV